MQSQPTIPQPSAGPGGPLRPESVPISDGPPPRRRRRSLMVIGLLLALLGALGSATLVRSAGDRVDVLALAREVPAGQQIEAADLRVAALPEDPALAPLRAAQRDDVVGRRAASTLAKGSLLTRADLASGSGLATGEELVAVEVARGMAPTSALVPGARVRVVSTPGKDEEIPKGRPAEVDAQVVKVGSPNAAGAVVVHLSATSTDSSVLAARAATGRIALVMTGNR